MSVKARKKRADRHRTAKENCNSLASDGETFAAAISEEKQNFHAPSDPLTSIKSNSRINQSVQYVGKDVPEKRQHRVDDKNPHYDGIITLHDCVESQIAESIDIEDELDEIRPGHNQGKRMPQSRGQGY